MAKRISSLSEIILFENEHLMVVNKPPHLSSLDERSGGTYNLLGLARKYVSTAQLCHRLDKETSGALVIAKTSETYRHISLQFQNRQVRKLYHAVVSGVLSFGNEEMEIQLPLTAIKGKARIDKHKGKPAVTIVRPKENFRHFTLCECQPLTGRFHQIRIHLSAVKAPIVSDILYDGTLPMLSKLKRKYHHGQEKEERPIMQRVALHAHTLEFTDPEAKAIAVEAPYPDDFATLMKLLRKYDSL
ncbi:MAG: RluA family pseudouridine synthase [Bacteroidia bacterium]